MAGESPAKYQISRAGIDELKKRFSYHSPKDDQPARYEALRADFGQLAYNVVVSTPQSREQALALTYLEMASMFANAAIARNE